MKPTFMSQVAARRAEVRRIRRNATQLLPLRERLAMIDAIREQEQFTHQTSNGYGRSYSITKSR